MKDWNLIKTYGVPSPKAAKEMERGLQKVAEAMVVESPGMTYDEAREQLLRQQAIDRTQRMASVLERALNLEYGTGYVGDWKISVLVEDNDMFVASVVADKGPIKFAAEHKDVFPSVTLCAQLALLFK